MNTLLHTAVVAARPSLLRGVPARGPGGREGLGAKGIVDLRKIHALAKG
jgi:hypothetical protein